MACLRLPFQPEDLASVPLLVELLPQPGARTATRQLHARLGQAVRSCPRLLLAAMDEAAADGQAATVRLCRAA